MCGEGFVALPPRTGRRARTSELKAQTDFANLIRIVQAPSLRELEAVSQSKFHPTCQVLLDACTNAVRPSIKAIDHALGTEDVVRQKLTAFESAGATDLRVNVLCPTPDETERTRAFLRMLCAEKNSTAARAKP